MKISDRYPDIPQRRRSLQQALEDRATTRVYTRQVIDLSRAKGRSPPVNSMATEGEGQLVWLFAMFYNVH